jgi:hypothetical protein
MRNPRQSPAPAHYSRLRLDPGWVLFACWLALLVMPSASLWANRAPSLTSRAILVKAQALPSVSGDGDAGGASDGQSASDAQHQYWQVGLTAGPETHDAIGMRTSIVTRLPQVVGLRTTDYFWIGSYLADGSFVQIGYYVAWYDLWHAGWFYCAFTASGEKGPCVYGPAGSAGGDGVQETYTLEATTPSMPFMPFMPSMHTARAWTSEAAPVVWSAQVNGAEVGQFTWTSGTTGSNSPSIYAESSGFAPHAAASQLGPVDFSVAVQTRSVGQLVYTTADHVQPVYNGPDICPPYGVAANGQGGALLGSGLPCPSSDEWLW